MLLQKLLPIQSVMNTWQLQTRKQHQIKKRRQEAVDLDSCLLDFVELQLRADQAVGELTHFSLLLAAAQT